MYVEIDATKRHVLPHSSPFLFESSSNNQRGIIASNSQANNNNNHLKPLHFSLREGKRTTHLVSEDERNTQDMYTHSLPLYLCLQTGHDDGREVEIMKECDSRERSCLTMCVTQTPCHISYLFLSPSIPWNQNTP